MIEDREELEENEKLLLLLAHNEQMGINDNVVDPEEEAPEKEGLIPMLNTMMLMIRRRKRLRAPATATKREILIPRMTMMLMILRRKKLRMSETATKREILIPMTNTVMMIMSRKSLILPARATKRAITILHPVTVICHVKENKTTATMETLQHEVLSELKSSSAVLHKQSR